MTNPRQAEGGYSAQVPVKGPEDGVIHVGQQDVLRPSTREGLGGGGQSTGGWNCSALAPVRASGRDGSHGRLQGKPHPVYVRTSKAGAVHGKRPGDLG